MSSILTLYGPRTGTNASHFTLRKVCKRAGPGLLYAGLVSLTGCATSMELESLRAEVAQATATAVRAEAEVSRTQRELAALKASIKPPDTYSRPSTPPPTPLTRPGGYKWGKEFPMIE